MWETKFDTQSKQQAVLRSVFQYSVSVYLSSDITI
jgi:hypothetical protein